MGGCGGNHVLVPKGSMQAKWGLINILLKVCLFLHLLIGQVYDYIILLCESPFGGTRQVDENVFLPCKPLPCPWLLLDTFILMEDGSFQKSKVEPNLPCHTCFAFGTSLPPAAPLPAVRPSLSSAARSVMIP